MLVLCFLCTVLELLGDKAIDSHCRHIYGLTRPPLDRVVGEGSYNKLLH